MAAHIQGQKSWCVIYSVQGLWGEMHWQQSPGQVSVPWRTIIHWLASKGSTRLFISLDSRSSSSKFQLICCYWVSSSHIPWDFQLSWTFPWDGEETQICLRSSCNGAIYTRSDPGQRMAMMLNYFYKIYPNIVRMDVLTASYHKIISIITCVAFLFVIIKIQSQVINYKCCFCIIFWGGYKNSVYNKQSKTQDDML